MVPLAYRGTARVPCCCAGWGATSGLPIFPPRVSAPLPSPPNPVTPLAFPPCWDHSSSTFPLASLAQCPRYNTPLPVVICSHSKPCSQQRARHYFSGKSLCLGWFQPLFLGGPGYSRRNGTLLLSPSCTLEVSVFGVQEKQDSKSHPLCVSQPCSYGLCNPAPSWSGLPPSASVFLGKEG